MKVIHIEYYRAFQKSFKRLDKLIQLQVLKKEKIFRQNCFDPRLGAHKLGGALEGRWAFRINRSYRIIFKFKDGKAGFVGFIKVGTHDQMY